MPVANKHNVEEKRKLQTRFLNIVNTISNYKCKFEDLIIYIHIYMYF